MASSRSRHTRTRSAAPAGARASSGWKAASVCRAPVKLMARGAAPCVAAA
jgi:hypothetical protein